MTGEQLETEVYLGPRYYFLLNLMVKDKTNHRAKGPRSVLTRGTVGGRANDGGLRTCEIRPTRNVSPLVWLDSPMNR